MWLWFIKPTKLHLHVHVDKIIVATICRSFRAILLTRISHVTIRVMLWMNHHIPTKVPNVSTYLCPNFNETSFCNLKHIKGEYWLITTHTKLSELITYPHLTLRLYRKTRRNQDRRYFFSPGITTPSLNHLVSLSVKCAWVRLCSLEFVNQYNAYNGTDCVNWFCIKSASQFI